MTTISAPWAPPGIDPHPLRLFEFGRIVEAADQRDDDAVDHTAMVEGYALAGELALAGGDHRVAFPRYEARVTKFAQRTKKGGDTTGRFLAPRTAHGLKIRNYLHNQRWFMTMTYGIANGRSTGIILPDYESLVSAA